MIDCLALRFGESSPVAIVLAVHDRAMMGARFAPSSPSNRGSDEHRRD